MKPSITPAQLDMYFRCGRQYEYRHIDEIIVPPLASTIAKRAALSGGIMPSLRAKMESGTPMPEDEMEALARDAVAVERDAAGGVTDDNSSDSLEDSAGRMARRYAKSVMPNVNPSKLEHSYLLELKGYERNLSGSIDIQEDISGAVVTEPGPSVIIHRRTMFHNSGESHDSGLIAATMAVTAATGQAPTHTIINTIQNAKQWFPHVPIDAMDGERLLLRVGTMGEMLAKGVAMPAPQGSWYCNKDYCGYWGMCPYGQRSRTTGAAK